MKVTTWTSAAITACNTSTDQKQMKRRTESSRLSIIEPNRITIQPVHQDKLPDERQ